MHNSNINCTKISSYLKPFFLFLKKKLTKIQTLVQSIGYLLQQQKPFQFVLFSWIINILVSLLKQAETNRF